MSQQNPTYFAVPQPEVPQPKKKRRTGCFITIGVIVVVVIAIIAACSAVGKSVSDAISSTSADINTTPHKVVFKATANGKASVNWGASSGGSTADINGTWSKTKNIKGWDAMSLIVSGDMDGATKVTCKIIVDGKTVASESGSGSMATASCSADSIKN